MRQALAAALALLLSTLSAACAGAGGEPAPRPVSGPAKEVAEVVQAFERSLGRRELDRICSDLFSERLRARAGGSRCATTLRRTTARLREPRIELQQIELSGRRATARVSAGARGEPSEPDSIELVRRRGRYRISDFGR